MIVSFVHVMQNLKKKREKYIVQESWEQKNVIQFFSRIMQS